MKETNLEHYKEQLKTIFNEYYEEPRTIIKEFKAHTGVKIPCYGFESFTDAILNWMAQPYKKPILYEVEKKYLSDVIRPFRGNVTYIVKQRYYWSDQEYISIVLQLSDGFRDSTNLPNFERNTMYKGMEIDKKYSLEELGL